MSKLTNYFWRKYHEHFSKPENQDRNRKYITKALHAYGYGNSNLGQDTGEDYLINKVLPVLGPKVVFDIGANVGNYSRMILKALPSARLYSFEPLAEPYEALSSALGEYKDRAVPVPFGIGNETCSMDIHYDPTATSHASFSADVKSVPYVNNSQTRTIGVMTLDDYCDQHFDGPSLDFLKIDTEGFEAEVLQGAQDVLERYRPMAIQIEFNWHHLFRSHTLFYLSSFLNGYDAYQLVPGGMAKRDVKDPLSNVFAFSNFVFIRSDLVAAVDAIGLRT